MVHLVLLPGMDGTGELFADFVAALDPAVHAIVVRYPSNQALDYQGLEAHARTFLPAGAPYLLLGESFSGPIAIAIAASRPAGLIGLVLSCTFVVNPHPYLKHFRFFVRFVGINPTLARLFSPFMLGVAPANALRSALQNALSGLTSQVLRRRLNAVLDVDYAARMAAIDVPILYLQAGADRVVFASAARQLARLAPRATVIRLDGPHLLLQVKPKEAAAVVSEFVKRACQAIVEARSA